MSCNPKMPWAHGALAPEPRDDEEFSPQPSAEALLAGTLALMTGVVERAALAQPLTAHGQSLMMAAKVRSNLLCLTHHPQISDGFRSTLGRLRSHWDRLAVPNAVADGPPTESERAEAAQRLWHRAPERVQ